MRLASDRPTGLRSDYKEFNFALRLQPQPRGEMLGTMAKGTASLADAIRSPYRPARVAAVAGRPMKRWTRTSPPGPRCRRRPPRPSAGPSTTAISSAAWRNSTWCSAGPGARSIRWCAEQQPTQDRHRPRKLGPSPSGRGGRACQRRAVPDQPAFPRITHSDPRTSKSASLSVVGAAKLAVGNQSWRSGLLLNRRSRRKRDQTWSWSRDEGGVKWALVGLALPPALQFRCPCLASPALV
jgi:hypothetical protein